MASTRGPMPDRWNFCPRRSDSLIADKFLAFKAPLCDAFSHLMPEECLFTPKMVLGIAKAYKMNLGLWIDLTFTNRFYDRSEVEALGCRYVKLKCRGHKECPTMEQTRAFIEICDEFIREHPVDAIGVHCTHGFNRTGFLIVSYMVERMDCSVEAALLAFKQVRFPGIYKEDYIRELFRRYEDEDEPFDVPERPQWDAEEDEEEEYIQTNGESSSKRPAEDDGGAPNKRKRKQERMRLNATFMSGVSGVELLTDPNKLRSVQGKVQDMCEWEKNGFPGCQPVSMDRNNIRLLNLKPYLVSWKADGTRYMMLIDGEDEIYFFDRDFACFKVTGIRFPARKNPQQHLKNTLVDGEMVLDKVDGKTIPRYLVYDMIKMEGEEVGNRSFNERLACIDNEIIKPRIAAMKAGSIRKEREPFSIRKKDFWPVVQANSLLGDKFAKTLCHEPDGLIFQPRGDPYKPGRCDEVLKWKPAHMNSVDFRLKIVTQSGNGLLPTKQCLLFVGGYDQPIAQMKFTKALLEMDNKIIECKFANNAWIFMRERTDKSYPNSHTTALAVFESIKNPVTKEGLLSFIQTHRFKDDLEEMPPPRSNPSC